MESRSLPIVVGGFYRSGTSLVRRLLDAHSRIDCPPEIKFLTDFHAYYRDDPLAHARFFATLRVLGLPETELLEIYARAYREARERAARARGKSRWADKVPENVLFLDSWRQGLPDGFLFVHVVRHPLDALGSLKEVGFHKAVPSAIEERIALYRRFRSAGEVFALRFPHASFTLGYEALVQQPEATLVALFAFLEEPFERDVMVRYRDEARGSGLEDPKVARTDRIHDRSVGQSRAQLSPDETALASAGLARWL
jgi:hypothetical protein